MAKTTASADPKPEVMNPSVGKGGEALPDFDKWSDEQIGFAPYWKPAEGKWFFGAPVGIDLRDPKFIRYQFLAYVDTPCQRGPSDEDDERSESVVVKKGETFSLSVYFSLREVFDQYLEYGAETGKPVPVRVDALKTVPTKNQPKCWQFRARVEPTMKKSLTEWRAKNRKFLTAGTAASAERPALEE